MRGPALCPAQHSLQHGGVEVAVWPVRGPESGSWMQGCEAWDITCVVFSRGPGTHPGHPAWPCDVPTGLIGS